MARRDNDTMRNILNPTITDDESLSYIKKQTAKHLNIQSRTGWTALMYAC